MKLAIYIKVSDSVWQHWQTTQDFANQKITYFTNSAQMFGQSIQETVQTTTDNTIDAVTQTFNQSWQTAEEVKSMTSKTIQTALLNPTEGITSALNNWLVQHPTLWHLVQIINWAANHPIISVIVLLFALTLIWSIIRATMQLIEKASWSILQVPLKLLQSAITFSFFSLVKVFSVALQKSTHHQKIADTSALPIRDYQNIYLEKQQRLAEIALRLETIQQEQKELLQEAANLISQDSINVKIPDIIRNS